MRSRHLSGRAAKVKGAAEVTGVAGVHIPDADGEPDVSVVIPTLTAAGTLDRQLSALSRQVTSRRFELLVADNGGDPGVAELAARYRRRGMDVRVVPASARRGSYYARNKASAQARGELLLFLDADDVADLGWLEALALALATRDTDLVGGRLVPVPGGSDAGRRRVHGTLPYDGLLCLLDFLPFAFTANFGIRRAVFEALGGFDEELRSGGDVDLCWRAQLQGFSLSFAADAVVAYQFRPTSRALCRQFYRYAQAHPQLYKRFAPFGLPRRSAGAMVRSAGAVVVRSPRAVVVTDYRPVWFIAAATLVGRVRGSVAARSWYV